MEHLPVEVLSQLITMLAWLFTITGTAVVLLVVWIGKAVIKRLTGIEAQLMKTNDVLNTIERDFQTDLTDLDRRKTSEITSLDRRMAVVETRCATNHPRGL